jgi:hypothetical protein
MKMKKLIVIAFVLCVGAMSAAEVQIIVRNDADAVVVDETITTNNDVLSALETWRLAHVESYPTRESMFREWVVTQARRVLRAQGSAAIQAERDKIEAAKAAEDAIVEAAVPE